MFLFFVFFSSAVCVFLSLLFFVFFQVLCAFTHELFFCVIVIVKRDYLLRIYTYEACY